MDGSHSTRTPVSCRGLAAVRVGTRGKEGRRGVEHLPRAARGMVVRRNG